ncbi:rac GTPase-activating protein 1 [Condylostylus longicornis]|uniref:rac GTPase-activating protein 1 n=1 Tax=Condylostylus longicornis TaxID=2530218 RepID=UPI00244DF171|nr:rac GTPase-activating protein 1 [Condylostylus longicornis]
MVSTLSMLAEYDDIRRCQEVLHEGTAEEQFLRFAALQEECRLQWLAAIREAQRLKTELDEALKQMSHLESKLYHARRLLDVESKLRKEAEQEKQTLEKKLVAVANVVQDPSFPSETREKLEFIKAQTKKRKSQNNYEDKYGNDINSTGSFLSDLSVTQSEEDFLDGNCSRVWKKHRPSLTKQTGTFIGSKPSRSSRGLNESRTKAKLNGSIHQKQGAMDIDSDDKICATTKVTIPNRGDGPIIAESIIEALPKNLLDEKAPPQSTEPGSSDTKTSDEENGNFKSPDKKKSPSKFHTPTAPPLSEFSANINNINATPARNIRNSVFRHHCFASKTFIKPDNCSHCNKKIRFGSLALKCKNCRTSAHVDCKDLLTAPCVPSSAGGTPTFKGLMGYLTEYAPSTHPMIPAIIVHCVMEIERRGFSEVGIYRISGSEREVKALKEKFLRGKTPPHISNIDVHVLCGCVKDFLRSLCEPLVPTDLWSDFSNAVQAESEEEKRKELYRAIDRLPHANRDTLAYLVLHFQRITKCEEIKMPLGNIARVFGPTIVGYSSPDPDRNAIFSETMIQFQVMENLINIPEDYWNKYVQAVEDNDMNTLSAKKSSYSKYKAPPPPPSTFQTPNKDGLKTLYSTPFKGSIRKDRKFYGTPPYSSKKY